MLHKALFLSLATVVLAAPTRAAPASFNAATRAAPTSLDAATLLQNGQAAQALNRNFRTLNASDPCQAGQVACLGRKNLATCEGTSWAPNPCSSGECFALPSSSSQGTNVTCTSAKNAESLISATGATGGIFGHQANGTKEAHGRNGTQFDGTEPRFGGNGTHFGGNGTHFAGNGTHFRGNGTHFAGNGTHFRGNGTHFRGNGTHFAGNGTHFGGNRTHPGPHSGSDRNPQCTDVPSPTASGSTLNDDVAGNSTAFPSHHPCHIRHSGSTHPKPTPITVQGATPSQLLTLPTTFAPQTQTLSPEAASSLLVSLVAAGGSIVSFDALPTSTIASGSNAGAY